MYEKKNLLKKYNKTEILLTLVKLNNCYYGY